MLCVKSNQFSFMSLCICKIATLFTGISCSICNVYGFSLMLTLSQMLTKIMGMVEKQDAAGTSFVRRLTRCQESVGNYRPTERLRCITTLLPIFNHYFDFVPQFSLCVFVFYTLDTRNCSSITRNRFTFGYFGASQKKLDLSILRLTLAIVISQIQDDS